MGNSLQICGVIWCICYRACQIVYSIIQICSGITSSRVLNGELLYTKILEVNLFAFQRSRISLHSTGRICSWKKFAYHELYSSS